MNNSREVVSQGNRYCLLSSEDCINFHYTHHFKYKVHVFECGVCKYGSSLSLFLNQELEDRKTHPIGNLYLKREIVILHLHRSLNDQEKRDKPY
jgi:hypothetical protein